MIDISSECVLTLTEAAKRLPRRRAGKRPHVATLYRWAQRCLRGVQLETIQVGGTLCTSLEALQRFCERLTDPNVQPTQRASAERQRSIRTAEKRLEEMGL